MDLGGTVGMMDPTTGIPSQQTPKTLAPEQTPEHKQSVAAATATGAIEGKAMTEARIDLPTVKSNATYLTGIIDKAMTHPGREAATGKSSYLPTIRGTDRQNFEVLQDQIQGKVFMQAYQSLKGGGQITEIESEKATQALARLNAAQSEEEYLNALTEFKTEIQRLTALAESRARGGHGEATAQPTQQHGGSNDGWGQVRVKK